MVTETPIPQQDLLSPKEVIKRVSLLGLAFSFVFTGYNVAQSFVTTLYQEHGFTALCLIYISFAIGSLFAPFLNRMFELQNGKGKGEKISMIMAGCVYVCFILTLISERTSLVYIASCLKGLSSGFLWISQGVWLTKLVNEFKRQERILGEKNRSNIVGIATGMFFTLFNLNGILGNVLVILLMTSGVDLKGTMISMACVTGLGTCFILFCSDAPSEKEAEQIPLQEKSASPVLGQQLSFESVKLRVRNVYSLAKKKRTLLLMPYFLCQGVHMAYSYGNYPTFITFKTESDEQSDAIHIAYGFLLYGFGSMLGSYLWGKLYDYFHARLYPLLISHVFLVLVNYSILMGVVYSPQASFPVLIFCGFLFGMIDFLTNAIINNSIAKNYEQKDQATAFSWYRFCFCFGFALASGLSAALPGLSQSNFNSDDNWLKNGWLFMIILNWFVMLLSVLMGSFLVNKQQRQMQQQDSSFNMAMH